RSCSLLGQVGAAPVRQQLLAAAYLCCQPQDEPGRPLGLRALDDGAAVWQPRQRQQRTVAAVDAVEVDIGRRAGASERTGDGAQGLRAAAAGCADDVE